MKDGSRVALMRENILKGIQRACEKRPVSSDTMNAVVDRIEQRCTEMFDTEVSSKFIGQLVMEELKRLDPVAYVRFASVYREFKDVQEFHDELKAMIDAPPPPPPPADGGGDRKGRSEPAS